MKRKTKLWLFCIAGACLPSIFIWICGYALPTERSWYLLCVVLSSAWSALVFPAIARDFIAEDKP